MDEAGLANLVAEICMSEGDRDGFSTATVVGYKDHVICTVWGGANVVVAEENGTILHSGTLDQQRSFPQSWTCVLKRSDRLVLGSREVAEHVSLPEIENAVQCILPPTHIASWLATLASGRSGCRPLR